MTQPADTGDTSPGPSSPRARPDVLLFDVNETLSDMSPMADRFEDVGAPGHLARAWFAGLLRDGFALTAAGASEPFARVAEGSLRTTLEGRSLTKTLDAAVAHVMAGISDLQVHDDVPEGVRALSGLGIRLVTLSNGSSSIAQRLLGDAGLLEHFEQLLSVEDAGVWKPAADAYAYALQQCDVGPAGAMLVAVHPWDVDGARRSGLAGAWINRGGGTYPDYFTAPDLEAASLVDLADRLR